MGRQRIILGSHQLSFPRQNTMFKCSLKQILVFILEHSFSVRQILIIFVSSIPTNSDSISDFLLLHIFLFVIRVKNFGILFFTKQAFLYFGK